MIMLCMCLLPATAGAGHMGWKDYYQDDTNFPMVWGHDGWATFIDKSSLVVQRYDPPYYIIAINVFYVDDGGYGTIHKYDTLRFFYNYDTTKMYIDRTGGSGDWKYIRPNASVSEEQHDGKNVGEAAFYLAYRLRFYGAYRWKNTLILSEDLYQQVFPDEFYRKIQGPTIFSPPASKAASNINSTPPRQNAPATKER